MVHSWRNWKKPDRQTDEMWAAMVSWSSKNWRPTMHRVSSFSKNPSTCSWAIDDWGLFSAFLQSPNEPQILSWVRWTTLNLEVIGPRHAHREFILDIRQYSCSSVGKSEPPPPLSCQMSQIFTTVRIVTGVEVLELIFLCHTYHPTTYILRTRNLRTV